jgi:diaminopimelate epimerase
MRKFVAVDFVKGHMGGNEIVLLHGGQIPSRQRLETVLSILDPPSICGHQAVLVERPKRGGDVKVRVVDRACRNFITTCGGMTQVLCKAVLETEFGKPYRIRLPRRQLVLETDSGTVRVSVRGRRDKPTILTEMTSFVKECYRLGVSAIQVAGVEATRVGKFLVADALKIQEESPDADFDTMNRSAVRILTEMQSDFDRQRFLDARNAEFSLFSMYPDDQAHGRVLFPHSIAAGHVEPSCGSGSIAVAIALAQARKLRDGVLSLRFDSGGAPVLGGPETTQVNVRILDGRIVTAEFTHSLVEIVSTGKVWLRSA